MTTCKKILYILNDGGTDSSDYLINLQRQWHDVVVVDLRTANLSYKDLIDRIFSCDLVISW